MNICLVSNAYPPERTGGIGTYTKNLAEELVSRGHRVVVIAKTWLGSRREEINGVLVVRVNASSIPLIEPLLPNLAWSYRVLRLITGLNKTHHFDIVEFPNWDGPGFCYLLQRHRLPVATRLHTPFFETLSIKGKKPGFGDRFNCWQEKQAVLKSDSLSSSTRHHAAMMEQTYGIDSSRIRLLPLGIVPPEFQAEKKPDAQTVRLLYISRMEPRKGTMMLLHAMPRVFKAVPNARLTLVGRDKPQAPGGILFSEYFKKNYGEYADKVEFTGYVEDDKVAGYYRNADLFVVPSFYESFGLIYVEAMSHGLPVVACAAGGVPEVVGDSSEGYLVPVEDEEALVGRIVELCNNPALRVSMGKRGREKVEAQFNRIRMADETLKLYEETIRRL